MSKAYITDIMLALLFLLLLTHYEAVSGNCPHSNVFLRLGSQMLPNNSYVLFRDIDRDQRLHCHTDKQNCCNFDARNFNGDWHLPDGERVLGGYEYSNANNKFARSRGYRNVGLYRHGSPPQRGRFFCHLPDSSGAIQTMYAMIVNEIPEIIIQPISQAVKQHENVTFAIDLSFSHYSTYQWKKNNISLTDEPERRTGTTTKVLTLIDAQEDDEGYYYCVVDNTLISHRAELSVVISPIVLLQNLTELNITLGDNIDFTFNTTSEFINASSYWEKDGVNLSMGHKYRGVTTNTLTLLNAHHTDEGMYILIIESDNHSTTPLILHLCVFNVSVKVDAYIKPDMLLCAVKDVPEIASTFTIQWYKDNDLLYGRNESNLTLTHDDVGDYRCVVNITSMYLSAGFTTKTSDTFKLRLSNNTFLTLKGRIISNNSFIYYDEIDQHGLACYTNNSDCCGASDNPQGHAKGNWFFPNGNSIPSTSLGQQPTANMFTERSHNQIVLHRRGRITQSGLYNCIIPNMDINETQYIYIGTRVSLSLKGVTLYNNSQVYIDDIGDDNNKEAVLCHTDTRDEGALGVWFYPDSSTIPLVNDDYYAYNNTTNVSCFLMRRLRNMIRLFRRGQPSSGGNLCCEITDREGLNHTMCINIAATQNNVVSHVCPRSNTNFSEQVYQLLIERMNYGSVEVRNDSQGNRYSLQCRLSGISQDNCFVTSYQWYKDGTLICGAVMPTLNFSSLTLLDSGNYSCEVYFRLRQHGFGTIKLSMTYTLNIPSTYFQVRFRDVKNCLQWTSSDMVAKRVQDVVNTVALLVQDHCQCNFTINNIKNGGFQCFRGSESHVTFRATLKETDKKTTRELVTYLEVAVNSSQYWLVHGQYLSLNHSCSLIITDVHSPECRSTYFTNTNDTTTYLSTKYSHIGYFVWALVCTCVLIIGDCIVLLGILALRKKIINYSRPSHDASRDASDINAYTSATTKQPQFTMETVMTSAHQYFDDDSDYEVMQTPNRE